MRLFFAALLSLTKFNSMRTVSPRAAGGTAMVTSRQSLSKTVISMSASAPSCAWSEARRNRTTAVSPNPSASR